MKFSKLIEEFRTIRDYKKETIEQEQVQEILQGGKAQKGIGEGEQVSVFFIEQGKEVYKKLSGKAGYFGKMMEAPHYLVITSKVFPGYLANSGYMMEQMRLKAWELGLGTCWLSIEDPEDIKKVLSIDSDEIVTAFAAIGYPYTGIFKKDISPKSSRLGIEELIYSEHWGKPSTVEELENRALANVFYYTRYAPSWGNQQPWRFVLDKDKVILTLYQDQEEDMELDGGIVMLYLQRAANEEGIAGQWHIEDGENLRAPYGIPKEYRILGYFPL